MTHYLEKLFTPRSIAVLGVSATRDRGAHDVLRGLRREGYDGRMYAVGRGGGEFEEMPIYRSIEDVPETPDLVFSAVSSKATPNAMIEAANAGVHVGIIYTAGFAEMNDEGAVIQADMIRRCNQLGMRIVGPNCMGVVNQNIHLNLTSLPSGPYGPLALVSQSGNIGISLIHEVPRYRLGFNMYVSFGNQADVPIEDYIAYLATQDCVKVVVLYLEALQDGLGSRFIRVCREISRTLPIVGLKGGVTEAGRRAAESHTARLSGTREIYSAAFRQAGIVEVHDLDHLLPVVEAIYRCPPLRSDSIAIVGSGGGHSTIAADETEKAGLTVPPFGSETVDRFQAELPPWAPKRNPVDMTGGFTEDLTLFSRMMEIPLAQGAYGGGLGYGLYGLFGDSVVDHSGLSYVTAAPLLGDLQKKLEKPIVFYTPYADSGAEAFVAMREHGVPCFATLAAAAAALGGLRNRFRASQLSHIDDGMPAAWRPGEGEPTPPQTLPEAASLELIARGGVTVVRQRIVGTADAAAAAAEELGYPIGEHADAYAATLSGGQRKLLELARALMPRPRLLMLDEPLAGVNPTLGRNIMRYIDQLRTSGDTTVMFVEHDLESVMTFADNVIVMAEGKVLVHGSPDAIRRDERVILAYLGATTHGI